MSEIEALRAELAAVKAALDATELRPGGTLAERIATLDHHRREWKNMFIDMCDRHNPPPASLRSSRRDVRS